MRANNDYYESLCLAVARLKRNSYAARGVIYDRAWEALSHELSNAIPAYSRSAIAAEKRAFKEAIRLIESRYQAEQTDRSDGDSESSRDRHGRAFDPAGYGDFDEAGDRRSTFGRVTRRMAFATALVAVAVIAAIPENEGWLGVATARSQVLQSLHDVLGSESIVSAAGVLHRTSRRPTTMASLADDPDAPRVFLYEQDPRDPNGRTYSGRAIWEVTSDGSASSSGKRQTVVVKLGIPEKNLTMTMSIRPAGDDSPTMTHLMEMRFGNASAPDAGKISQVSGVMMSGEQQDAREELVGQAVRVTPDVFLYGLSGSAVDARRNSTLLRQRGWMDVLLVYKDGSPAILAIEKGRQGNRALSALVDAGPINESRLR